MNKDYSIEETPLAENQILQIGQYIIEEFQAPETALRVVDRIEQELSKLNEMPERIVLVASEPWRSRVVAYEPFSPADAGLFSCRSMNGSFVLSNTCENTPILYRWRDESHTFFHKYNMLKDVLSRPRLAQTCVLRIWRILALSSGMLGCSNP